MFTVRELRKHLQTYISQNSYSESDDLPGPQIGPDKNSDIEEQFFCPFLLQIFALTQEQPPDSRRPLDTYYDENMGRLMTYTMEVKYIIQ